MTAIQIEQVMLHHIKMPLVSSFVTSQATIHIRNLIIVQAIDQSQIAGWGECVAFDTPWYTAETQASCLMAMRDVLIPEILGRTFEHPNDVASALQIIENNQMAKAGLEAAIWDVYAQKQQRSLAEVFGGKQLRIPAGISLGLHSNDAELLNTIDLAVKQGYQKIKLKISRSFDIKLFETIRDRHPHIPLSIDANGDFTLDDLSLLQKLEPFQLLMIEQPLATSNLDDYTQLQSKLAIPICLDESIQSFADAKKAVSQGACQVVNIKQARVGGITEAIKIHDYCEKMQVPVWCGGMLESGIARAQNIALASLPNFTIAGDISASSRYWHRDIIIPAVEVVDGWINVPFDQFGLGFEIDLPYLSKVTDFVERISL